LVGGAAGVEQHVPVLGGVCEAGEHVDLVQQRRVLHDEHVRCQGRLAEPDRPVVDSAVRAGALGAEAREHLGVPAAEVHGDGEQFGGDHPLAAAAVDAY
jgi:hypothetical protein